MKKTYKELLEEVMKRVKEKKESKLEFEEKVRQIEKKREIKEEKKSKIIGYLGNDRKKKVNFCGILRNKMSEEKEKK